MPGLVAPEQLADAALEEVGELPGALEAHPALVDELPVRDFEKFADFRILVGGQSPLTLERLAHRLRGYSNRVCYCFLTNAFLRKIFANVFRDHACLLSVKHRFTTRNDNTALLYSQAETIENNKEMLYISVYRRKDVRWARRAISSMQ